MSAVTDTCSRCGQVITFDWSADEWRHAQPCRPATPPEPPMGSVVLLHGETGTAAQRFYSDALWHIAGARGGITWRAVLARCAPRNPVLIHTTDQED